MLTVASSALIKVTPGLMIWTLVSFGITLFVLWRFVFGPVQKTIDERRQRIRNALEEAERARAEGRRLLEEHRGLIDEGRRRAEEILEEARRTAEAMRERVRDETDADRRRRLEETKRQIEAETKRAIGQIRAEVAELTVLATARVTGKVLDEKDHRRLIEEAVTDLDFSALEQEPVR